MQRYAVDYVFDKNIRMFEAGAPNGRRVACIGSGPASLAMMGGLVARGLLDPGVSMETGWKDLAAAADALIDRKVAGKAVLLVD